MKSLLRAKVISRSKGGGNLKLARNQTNI